MKFENLGLRVKALEMISGNIGFNLSIEFLSDAGKAYQPSGRRKLVRNGFYSDPILPKCQGKKEEMDIEFGRSSFYEEDSIYLNVDGKSLVMDRATAKKFVEAAAGVGTYFGFLD